ncbi:MAG: hypothetical protein LQ342_003513 [Letrouitia transgressa]|nr:MAG: hypothetical protein LQ342_003513 [Letrouitia transgressa]
MASQHNIEKEVDKFLSTIRSESRKDHHFSCTWCGQRNHAENQCQYKKEGVYKANWRQLEEPSTCRGLIRNITGLNFGPALSNKPHGAQSNARNAVIGLESGKPVHRGMERSENHVNIRHKRTFPKFRTSTDFGGSKSSEPMLPGRLRTLSSSQKTTGSKSIYSVSRSPYEFVQNEDEEVIPPGRDRSRSPYKETAKLVRYAPEYRTKQLSTHKTSSDGQEKSQASKDLEFLEQDKVDEQRHKAKMKRRREEMELELQHEQALADIRARSQQ